MRTQPRAVTVFREALVLFTLAAVLFAGGCTTYSNSDNSNPVNSAPAITTNPASQTVTAGQTATFTAAASGTPAPTVQWQVSTNGGTSFSDMTGANSTTLTLTTALPMNGNQYHAVFTNPSGNITTTPATLTVNVAPSITLQPSNQTVNAGQAATFTATASGTPAPTVQWQVSTNGGTSFSDLAGASSTTLSLTNTTASMNGNQYHAVFTNASGNVTTAAATLTVNFAPTITLQPSNQTVTAGQAATFTAAASGSPAPTVQWQVSTNGGTSFSDLAGANSTTLTFTTALPMSGNQYHAVFTNASGNITTTAATLTVNVAPLVTLQPSNQTVNAGQTATFTAAATATPAPTVQWQVSTNGGASFSDLAGANSTTLSLTNTTASMNGNQYHAVFSNASGNVTTTAATLTVNFPPTITLQPSNQTVTEGQSATFTAAANGSPAPTVQWQVSTNGGASFSDVAGANSTSLMLTNTTSSMNGNQYHAVFTNASGNVTTTAATLTVNVLPLITLQPSNQAVTAGQTATFTATATGTPAPTVQWQVSTNGGTFSDVAGASSATLTITSATASMSGNQYHAVFTNVSGNITTTAATLTVNFAPTITLQPSSQMVTAGQTATFTAAASGTPTPTVQWQVSTNGGAFSDVPGASSTTLSLTNTTAAMNGNQYHAVFTNASGNITTTAATLTVNFPPTITIQPSNQTVAEGQAASFTAAANGNPAPTVQWQVSTNGGTFSDVPGASSTTLSLASTTGSMNGNQYHAVFTNASGNVTTTAATLTVNVAPSITLQPSDQTANAGQTATFTAAAGGNPAPTVQWQVSTNGGAFSDVPGASSATLLLTNTTGSMNGNQYHAVFTNALGNVTTTAATLTVNFAPTITLQPSNQTAPEGQAASFTATANGNPAPTVQWQVSTNGGAFSDVAGASSTTLTITSTTASMSGNQYHAVFTNALGNITTTAATLTVNFAPTITLQPSNQTVTAGQTATFTAAASGTPTPTVQWQMSTNGGTSFSDVAGASSATLTLTSTTASMNGNQYHAVFTNASGSVTTTAATLTVNFAPTITQQPTNRTVTAGQTAVFKAVASGNPAPTVQWQVSTNGGTSFSDLAGATFTTLNVTLTTLSMNGNQYHAVFTNTLNTATSAAATLTVNPQRPAITQDPSDQSVTVGQTATFTAAATATPSPTVQWQVSTDGGTTSYSDIAGATSTTLTLTNTTALMNGNRYLAVFTNPGGSSLTASAVLHVYDTATCAGAPSGHESVLLGHWAVMLQGWQGTGPGSPVASVFSFDASGTGSGSFVDVTGGSGITGHIDANFGANGGNSVFSDELLTTGSSYKVGLDPTNNSGYLGCMVLAMKSGGTTTLRFAVSVVAGTAVRGRIMRWTDTTGDGSEIRASGIMLPQDTTAFALSHLRSNYALGADGTDPNGGHLAFAGTIGINGSGTVTSSEFDSNDAGNLQTDLSYISASIATTSTGSTTAQTGRTLFTGTVPTAAGTSTNHSAAYIVNANEFFFVGIDPFTTSAIFSGRGISTAASFSNTSNSSLNGNYVAQIYGATTGNASCNNSGPCATVGLGVLQFSGTGTLNSASTLYRYQQGVGMQLDNPSGTYAVSPSGRVTITGSKAQPVLYLATPQSNTEPITAFSVATDSGAHSSASFGIMEAGANSNVSASVLAGNRIFGSSDPGDSTVQDQSGVVNVDSSGNMTGYRYSSDTNGLTESTLSDGSGGAPLVTITNSPLPGFGDVGGGTVAVTDGSTFWFFDTGSTLNPASINISAP